MKKAGIVIFLIGLTLTLFTTITFFTKEKVVDLGNVEITARKAHHFTHHRDQCDGDWRHPILAD